MSALCGRVVEAPGMGPIWLSGADYGRIHRLAEQTNKSESEVVSAAIKHYDELIRIVDLMADLPNP